MSLSIQDKEDPMPHVLSYKFFDRIDKHPYHITDIAIKLHVWVQVENTENHPELLGHRSHT
jgi:hypothetical protein